jgi:hypothetical protein
MTLSGVERGGVPSLSNERAIHTSVASDLPTCSQPTRPHAAQRQNAFCTGREQTRSGVGPDPGLPTEASAKAGPTSPEAGYNAGAAY